MERYLFLYEEDGYDKYEFVDAVDVIKATVEFCYTHYGCNIRFIIDSFGSYLYDSEENK